MIQFAKKIIQKIKIVWPNLVYLKHGKSARPLYRILRPYYILRNTRPVWFYFVNRKARKLYEATKQSLNQAQERIANDLKKYGIAFTSVDELFPGRNLLPVLKGYAERLADQGIQRTKGKLYVADLWDKTQIDLQNPFIQTALTPEVMGVADAYLGVRSKFFTSLLNIVSPVGDAEPISSQRWHRDPEDKKLCKMFIYLSDVDENAGPFSYIAESHADGRWKGLFPQKPPQGHIDIHEDAIRKMVPKENIKVATDKAGTIIFCDTAGIHRGGHARSKTRLMFSSGFCSPASLWATKFVYPRDFESHISHLDEAAQYALRPWYRYTPKNV